MKHASRLLIMLTTVIINSVTYGQTSPTNTSLSAKEYESKIQQTPAAAVIDVRTPEEFTKGHLANAKNINWNGPEFQEGIAKIDKSKPVFVYCLSGKRSAAAANKMRADGFKEVYELNGGMMQWRAANLPEVGNTLNGITKQQFDELLKTDKLVLIDFYADWCEPCKKMKPYLDEISHDMNEKVKVVSLNADNNQTLCKELKVDGLPVLQLYKNNTLTWSNVGFIEKEAVVKVLNK